MHVLYNVRYMQQIMNITQARNTLSQLVSDVAKNKKSVVIIRDSMPEAVLVSYDEFVSTDNEKQDLWALRFDRMLRKGKQAFAVWAKKNKIAVNLLSEEDAYKIIKKA